MLSSFDDFPIHAGSRPVAATATSDPNHYDRYFFNGYSRTQEDGDALYFALAMGLYPNRHVADAAFSVVLGGSEQISVHASRRAPTDRAAANRVGPIRVEVLEPLRTLRLLIDAPEQGLVADLTFRARSEPIEEPHFLRHSGQRIVMDYTRLTQFGRWTGEIEVDGRRHRCSAEDTWGSRDRSWGIRPIGERAAIGAPQGDPQFYWLWAPINFGTFATHVDVNEEADGTRWHESGFIVVDDEAPTAVETIDYRIGWRPGTRAAADFAVTLGDGATGTEPTTVTLEPLYDFIMSGLGYGHPEWSHGVWKGESAVGSSRWSLPVATPCALEHVHVQTICRARATGPLGPSEGLGILESFVIGAHLPTGLTGLLDPA